jgi:transposase
MARYGRLLTDAQWEKIRPLLPKRPKRDDYRMKMQCAKQCC